MDGTVVVPVANGSTTATTTTKKMSSTVSPSPLSVKVNSKRRISLPVVAQKPYRQEATEAQLSESLSTLFCFELFSFLLCVSHGVFLLFQYYIVIGTVLLSKGCLEFLIGVWVLVKARRRRRFMSEDFLGRTLKETEALQVALSTAQCASWLGLALAIAGTAGWIIALVLTVVNGPEEGESGGNEKFAEDVALLIASVVISVIALICTLMCAISGRRSQKALRQRKAALTRFAAFGDMMDAGQPVHIAGHGLDSHGVASLKDIDVFHPRDMESARDAPVYEKKPTGSTHGSLSSRQIDQNTGWRYDEIYDETPMAVDDRVFVQI